MKKLYISLFLFILTASLAIAQAPVTFTVEVPEGTTSVSMRGEFWGWDPNAGPVATSNGLDNTWSVTLYSDNATRVAFEYDWYVDGAFETVPTGCTGRVQGLNINDYGAGVNRKYDPTQTSVHEIVNSCYIATAAMEFKGVFDFTVPEAGSNGKALHFYVNNDIADLSVYGVGSANNGGGTDGQEYTFPAISVSAGEHILLARGLSAITNYFINLDQFDITIENTVFPDANGDDAYELFFNLAVIETFGDIDCRPSSNGTTTVCPNYQYYEDAWAYKELGSWVFGDAQCTDGSTTTQSSSCVYPFADATLSNKAFTKSELSIYPNPVNSGFVNIKSQISGDKTVKLYDLMGRQVLNTTLKTDILNVNSVQSGLYLLNVSIDDRSSTIKLMID